MSSSAPKKPPEPPAKVEAPNDRYWDELHRSLFEGEPGKPGIPDFLKDPIKLVEYLLAGKQDFWGKGEQRARLGERLYIELVRLKNLPENVLNLITRPIAQPTKELPGLQDVPPGPKHTPKPKVTYSNRALAPPGSDEAASPVLPADLSGKLPTHSPPPLTRIPANSLTLPVLGEPMVTAEGRAGELIDNTIYPNPSQGPAVAESGPERKLATIPTEREVAAPEEEMPAWAKLLIDKVSALADANKRNFAIISEELFKANERGTHRSPLVVLPPRGNGMAAASRSHLYAQRRLGSRSAAPSGDPRIERSTRD